jgi:hypothetical protein
MLATLDPQSGRLDLDRTFREPGAEHAGVFFGRTTWPHGDTGAAIPHGAVFSNP